MKNTTLIEDLQNHDPGVIVAVITIIIGILFILAIIIFLLYICFLKYNCKKQNRVQNV